MKADELLFWLSARHEGSWQQYRAAFEKIHEDDIETSAEINREFPLYQQFRLDLERLAHIEFFSYGCEKGWRIVPPILAAHSASDGICAILCGARSPALIDRVLCTAKNIPKKIIKRDGLPEVIKLIDCDRTSIAKVASQAGLSFQLDAPLSILTHLPACEPPKKNNVDTEFPVGADWRIQKFDVDTLGWRIVDRNQIVSARYEVYRFTNRYQPPVYFLCWNNAIYKLSRAISIYVLLKRKKRNILSYDGAGHMLRIPASCRPPRLLERALTLCSGLPPVYEAANANLIYTEISPEIARLAAELLLQKIL